MKIPHPASLRVIAGLLAICPFVPAAAQTAPSAPPASEDVVTLSPFEVKSTGSQRYTSSSSVSASRIAVPLVDLPSSVAVINEKLIEDMVAVSPADTFNLVSGVTDGNQGTGTQENSQVSIRGYELAGAQRDGLPDLNFTAAGGFDYALVDRIEIAKGPSGILYGSHSPGGVINFVSKRPLLTPRTRIGAMIGSHNEHRADLDVSGLLGGKRWGYRLSAAYYNTDGPVEHPSDKDLGGRTVINPSVMYRGADGLQVWAWTAFVRDEVSRAATIGHGFRTSGTGTNVNTPAVSFPTGTSLLGDFVRQGGGNNTVRNLGFVNNDSYELGASRPFELGPVRLDVRLIGRRLEQLADPSRLRGIGPGGITDAVTNTAGTLLGVDSRIIDFSAINNGQLGQLYRTGIRYDRRPSESEVDLYSADFNFAFEAGPTRHQLLVFGITSKSDSSSLDYTYDVNLAAGLRAMGVPVVGTQGRVYLYPISQFESLAGVTAASVLANHDARTERGAIVGSSENTAFGAIERMSFFKDRAFLVLGARHSEATAKSARVLNNVVTAPSTNTDKQWTYSYALLAKPYVNGANAVSAFINVNETFIPVTTLDGRRATFGQKFPNRIASTQEFGLKAELLEGKLGATFSYFDNEEDNVLLGRVDDAAGSVTGIPQGLYSEPAGRRTTKGYEIDLVFSPARGLDVVLGMANIDAKLASGVTPEAIPDRTYSALARYAFERGAVRGLNLSWAYSFWGESLLNTRTSWVMPSGDNHSAVIGYGRGKWQVRLRVDNVFDQQEIRPSAFETGIGVTDPRSYRLSYVLTF